jgi:hypothetical protein
MSAASSGDSSDREESPSTADPQLLGMVLGSLAQEVSQNATSAFQY